ncbi:MAG: bifunctional diguanylate cyclase/phosphodiesterase [Azonexus sp.]|nr:bifunctional diguanylate cyclase/phosphodiesterase [Azonexus sp.]MCK6411803.1 bifunctional diguanylate cyclase/phosphodiesterase [Azonexus sp.]
MKSSPPLWQRSLLYRTVASIVAMTLLVGGLLVAGLSVLVKQKAESEAYRRLGELIDTVESTVRIACFVKDEQLAAELARGLLRTQEISAVRISEEQKSLAYLERSPPAAAPLERQISSPFNEQERVGSIVLYPDQTLIEERIITSTVYIASQFALLIAAVAAALTLTVYRLVIRPIARLSHGLHELDAESGARLYPPLSHEHNLLGTLTADINALTARLVTSLHDEQALHRQQEIDERKYRGIFENAESGIFVADGKCRMTSYNRSLARQLGLPPAGDGNETLALSDLPWADRGLLPRLTARCLDENIHANDDFELMHPEYGWRWLNFSLTPVGPDLVQGIVSDVTDRRDAETRARRLAITDPLTGLPNRGGFEQQIKLTLGTRPEEEFALLLLDLDGFRQINDALGFNVGDQVLVGMAARLLAALKSEDTVARLGGDDFAILLPGVSSSISAGKLAQRLKKAISEPVRLENREHGLRASIGLARYPADGSTLPELLRHAELALACAQSDGGNTWRIFEPSMAEAVELRQQLSSDLLGASARDELRLHYQPIIDLRNHRVSSAECLLRWQHPTLGMIAPDRFIPLAEETGLIEEIGLWCLETACRQLAAWDARGLGLNLTVNVSARQIPSGLPPETVLRLLARHGLPPSRIGLEITESTLIGDRRAVEAWLEALRGAGCWIYLDDFGTGYSSLSYLKSLQLDTLKIDKAFVRDLNEASHDRVMVEAVTMMADSLQLSVVAEGIETQEQLQLLRRMGCRYGQGYLFSRPVPAEQLPEAVARIDALASRTTI